jgi:hypothetical protein
MRVLAGVALASKLLFSVAFGNAWKNCATQCHLPEEHRELVLWGEHRLRTFPSFLHSRKMLQVILT